MKSHDVVQYYFVTAAVAVDSSHMSASSSASWSSRFSTPSNSVKAKFHYTDPTRTRHRPDRTRTDPHGLFCGETPLGPCGSGRVSVVEFSSYSTTCADFVRVRSVSGPCS